MEELILYLRADFPHDAYWTQATVTLSDGLEHSFALERRDGPQRVPLGARTVRWLKLHRLVKSDEPSTFPALRQLMAMGWDIP